MEPVDLKEFAAQINSHLANGGKVLAVNHLKATVFNKRFAGMFAVSQSSGNLRVKVGKKFRDLTTARGRMFIAKICLQ